MSTFYKKLPVFSILLCWAPLVFADQKDVELARSVLGQVEVLSRGTTSLDTLGKETLTQASTIMDLGDRAAPELQKAVSQGHRDWKSRYWACDLLGYVGEEKQNIGRDLLKLVRNERENKLIRLRALDSLREIGRRDKDYFMKLKPELARTGRTIKDKEVKRKIRKLLSSGFKPS